MGAAKGSTRGNNRPLRTRLLVLFLVEDNGYMLERGLVVVLERCYGVGTLQVECTRV